jgi:hypothetical protein
MKRSRYLGVRLGIRKIGQVLPRRFGGGFVECGKEAPIGSLRRRTVATIRCLIQQHALD